MPNSKALTVAGTSVRQMNGLYSLNDLHKASGAEAKHQPGYFMRRDETQALIAEICSADSQIKALEYSEESRSSTNSAKSQSYQTKEGRGGGTYACKELVIAYAAWISAAFHLKVIRVFLVVATPFAAHPGQTLSEEQTATLRNLLTDGVKKLPKEKQGGAMVKGWSKLKAHFKTDYRHIPVAEFHEAVNILARHVADWEVVDEEPAPAMNLDDAVRLDLAFSMSAQAGAQVQRSVFASVMQGDADWTCKRYISNLTYDRMTNRLTAPATRAMDHGEMVTTLDKLPDWINGNDPIFASDEQLANIAMACTMRLSRNMSRQSAIRN